MLILESRKVQRVGASTLAISLPKEWVNNLGLKKGELIFFEEDEDGVLKLMTLEQMKQEQERMVEVNADLCNDPKMLGRILTGIYSLGYDTVRIVSAHRLKNEHVDRIRDVTSKMMGIGIMEETNNQVTLQCSLDITKFPIHTLLRRLYIIASTMHKEVIDALSEFEVRLAEGTIRRKREAETMFWILVRLLNSCQKDKNIAKKLKVEGPFQILRYRLIAQYLRLIADWAEKIAKKVIALRNYRKVIGEDLLNEITKINEQSYGACHKAINSFFSRDVYLANEVMETYDEIQKAEEKLQEVICSYAYLHGKSFSVNKYFKGEKPIEPCTVAQISFMIWGARRIAELGSEIAETAIHRTLCNKTKLCKELPITD